MKRLLNWIIVLSILSLSTDTLSRGLECEIDNASLQAMPKSLVTFTRDDGSVFEIEVKTAKNNATRSAGFQRVCESTIEAEPILFLFQAEVTPRFHMNNVVAPIDIAFIDKNGIIESIHAMKPYSILRLKKKLYAPGRPVMYALEGHKDFYTKHRLGVGTKATWREL